MKKRNLLFMDFIEFKEILENLKAINSAKIILILKFIKYFAAITIAGIFIYLYYFCDGESLLRTLFKQTFGVQIGTTITIIFLSVIVCFLFFIHEIVFSFIPKQIILYVIKNAKHK